MQNNQSDFEVNRYEEPLDNVKRLDGTDSLTQAASKRSLEGGPWVVILQWFTYAFWIGTVLATSVVVASILTYFMQEDVDLGYTSLYGVAALLVLLPLAVFCDIFYSKYESEKKSTFSAVVMVIHAVGLALVGVGSLVVAVLSTVNLAIGATGTTETQITLYGSLFIAALSLIVFLRVILPNKMYWIRRYFVILMSIIVGIVIIISFVGPVGSAWMARNDKIIENNLPNVVDGIEKYVRANEKLPDSLDDISVKGDARKLISDNLVEYKKVDKPNNDADYYSSAYNYELCVEYKKDTNNGYDNYSSSARGQEYSSYISTYRHDAGNVCYKVSADDYSYGGDIVPMPMIDKTTN